MTMKKDPKIAAWHRGLAPKRAMPASEGKPRSVPQEAPVDDDSSKTEDLIHQMYL